MNSLYNRALHRYAVFTASCTFLLLIAGALVTSNDAGLSIPDWPLAYGSFDASNGRRNSLRVHAIA